MTWTPATPPGSTWAKDTTTSSSWSPGAPPFAEWDVESITDTPRITEAGARRVIEQAVTIRIIERYRVTWQLDAPPFATWT